MARWVVRFGYDGRPFAGWARQPGLRTIEGEILRHLGRCGVGGPSSAHLEVASRTDRGVSARANALALTSPLPGPSLLRALNGISPELAFTGAAEVAPGFRVRHARAREYRYLLSKDRPGIELWPELLPLFLRGPFDARSFSRGAGGAEPCWRALERLEIVGEASSPVLRVRASGFLWGMVRKIVAAVDAVGAGRLDRASLLEAIAGRRRLALPLADPERLILWEVDTGIPWQYRSTRVTRSQRAYRRRCAEEVEVRRSLVPMLWEGEGDPPVGPPERSPEDRPAPPASGSAASPTTGTDLTAVSLG